MTATHLVRTLLAHIAMAPDPEDGSFWLPPQISTVAHSVDWLFNFILAISVFFFILIVVLMVIFVLKYRRREGQLAEPSPTHNTALEVTNTEPFCIGCHEMRDNVYEELRSTIHYTNRSGVRATCPDCHVPHEWTAKIARKMAASKEV